MVFIVLMNLDCHRTLVLAWSAALVEEAAEAAVVEVAV